MYVIVRHPGHRYRAARILLFIWASFCLLAPSVLYAQSGGSQSSLWVEMWRHATHEPLHSAAVGDVTGEGHWELVALVGESLIVYRLADDGPRYLSMLEAPAERPTTVAIAPYAPGGPAAIWIGTESPGLVYVYAYDREARQFHRVERIRFAWNDVVQLLPFDLDGEGMMDVAILTRPGELSVFRWTPAGYVEVRIGEAAREVRSMARGQVRSDAHDDLVVARGMDQILLLSWEFDDVYAPDDVSHEDAASDPDNSSDPGEVSDPDNVSRSGDSHEAPGVYGALHAPHAGHSLATAPDADDMVHAQLAVSVPDGADRYDGVHAPGASGLHGPNLAHDAAVRHDADHAHDTSSLHDSNHAHDPGGVYDAGHPHAMLNAHDAGHPTGTVDAHDKDHVSSAGDDDDGAPDEGAAAGAHGAPATDVADVFRNTDNPRALQVTIRPGRIVTTWENYIWGSHWALHVGRFSGAGQTEILTLSSHRIAQLYAAGEDGVVEPVGTPISWPFFSGSLLGAGDFLRSERASIAVATEQGIALWEPTSPTEPRMTIDTWLKPVTHLFGGAGRNRLLLAGPAGFSLLTLRPERYINVLKGGVIHTLKHLPIVIDGTPLLSADDWHELTGVRLRVEPSGRITGTRGLRFLFGRVDSRDWVMNGLSRATKLPATLEEGMLFLDPDFASVIGVAVTWEPFSRTLIVDP